MATTGGKGKAGEGDGGLWRAEKGEGRAGVGRGGMWRRRIMLVSKVMINNYDIILNCLRILARFTNVGRVYECWSGLTGKIRREGGNFLGRRTITCPTFIQPLPTLMPREGGNSTNHKM